MYTHRRYYRIFMVAGLLLLLSELYGQTPARAYFWDNLPVAELPSFKRDTFDIKQFGAKPDGQTLNTLAINEAIKTCSEKGGGVVLIPGGVWLTGPVVMRNNVNLHLSRSAILLFSDDFNLYPLVETNYEGKPSIRNQSPVSGRALENIAITGRGVIDGNGDSWRVVTKDALTEREWKTKVSTGGLVSDNGRTWYPSEKSQRGHGLKETGIIVSGRARSYYEEVKDFLRPTLINLTGCRKVLIEGVTFQNSPAWGLHLLMCEDLTLRNAQVKNPDYAQNGDGLDLESSKNVVVEGCTFDVGDDGICIKSGKDEEGRKRGIPTENVVIRNCIVYKGHGGFVVGSEMSGGARNIFVSDCSFIGTDKGLRFKTARGRGGVVENIFIKDVYMKDIVDEAIYFDMYYFTKPPAPGEMVEVPVVTEATPQFKNISIDNVVCNGAKTGVFLRGLPEMSIRNISLSNLSLNTNTGIELIEARDISLKNIMVKTKGSRPLVYIEGSRGIRADGLYYGDEVELLCQVNGEKSEDIVFSNTRSEHLPNSVMTENGARANAVKFK